MYKCFVSNLNLSAHVSEWIGVMWYLILEDRNSCSATMHLNYRYEASSHPYNMCTIANQFTSISFYEYFANAKITRNLIFVVVVGVIVIRPSKPLKPTFRGDLPDWLQLQDVSINHSIWTIRVYWVLDEESEKKVNSTFRNTHIE